MYNFGLVWRFSLILRDQLFQGENESRHKLDKNQSDAFVVFELILDDGLLLRLYSDYLIQGEKESRSITFGSLKRLKV